VGTVKINATGSGEVPTGRVFVAQTTPNQFQKLILAGVAGLPLTAAVTATFTTPAGPTLPVTGASVTGTVVTGLVLLLVGGAVALLAIRRRRVRFTA
jgi:LPXTG-motif cell wall-anchored protein